MGALAINAGTLDRSVRIALGVTMLLLGFSDLLPGLWGASARIFGWYPLLTGLAGWCPLYSLLGIRTYPR